MAGKRSGLFSPGYGPKDRGAEKPEGWPDGSVPDGLAAGAADVKSCACTRNGEVRNKRNASLRRTAPRTQSKVSGMKKNLLLLC